MPKHIVTLCAEKKSKSYDLHIIALILANMNYYLCYCQVIALWILDPGKHEFSIKKNCFLERVIWKGLITQVKQIKHFLNHVNQKTKPWKWRSTYKEIHLGFSKIIISSTDHKTVNSSVPADWVSRSSTPREIYNTLNLDHRECATSRRQNRQNKAHYCEIEVCGTQNPSPC